VFAVASRIENEFVTVVESNQVASGVWDPHAYRPNTHGERLGDYVAVSALRRDRRSPSPSGFAPIEYNQISRGSWPAFWLERAEAGSSTSLPVVGEQALLFGTMRAYLGNVLVTPRREWVGSLRPLVFSVKSEFIQLVPNDGLVYYWWAYLRSNQFLANLPLGSGGTRPRMDAGSLLASPVQVHDEHTRDSLNARLLALAEEEWRSLTALRATLDSARL
jgi:hypothetical protein